MCSTGRGRPGAFWQHLVRDILGTFRRCPRDTGRRIVAAMTTTTAPVPPTEVSTGASRPRARRRIAVAAAAFVSCALPVTFTVTITAMLVTGSDVDHRFHQLTGKGLVLLALWLGSVLPLVRAGWGGRRPSTAAGYRHLAFIAAG